MPGHSTINILGVAPLDETLKKLKSGGGEIVMPTTELPGVGLLAYVKDPEGTLFGILQAVPGATM